MHVFITAIGTRGDVQPYLALGAGLRRAGHDVTLCTSPRYQTAAEGLDLRYGYLSDDLIALVETPQGRAAIEGAGGGIASLKALAAVMQRSMDLLRALVRDGWTAARAADPDLIVYHPKMAIALHYAEALGIPAVMAPLYPQFLPTAAYPNPGLPRLDLGQPLTGLYNHLTHRLVLAVVSAVSRRMFRAWREAHGLPPQPRGADVVHTSDGAHVPMLNAWSPHVAPDPPEWPPEAETTGYWFLNESDVWVPPSALTAFLAAGPPPVYVGFGSMAGRQPAQTTRIVLEALHRVGCRAVFARGWGGLVPEELPATVHVVDDVPHDWLFPRVAAVVHHGGAGTTAAGLRAGRPTLVCPFFGDQFFWAWRVREIGVGPAPVPQKRLTAERLAHALREATTSPSIRRTAEAVGQRLRSENGVDQAVAFLERRFALQSRPRSAVS